MKFRIFSKQQNLYTNSPLWPSNQRSFSNWAVYPSGEVVELVFFSAKNESVLEVHDSRNFIVEPYTGYSDSKGKKIYRGDLLQLDCFGLIYEIDWKLDRFVMKPKFEASGEIPDHFRDHKDTSTAWSVVGNIHGVEYED